jgi:hypothetical protein
MKVHDTLADYAIDNVFSPENLRLQEFFLPLVELTISCSIVEGGKEKANGALPRNQVS